MSRRPIRLITKDSPSRLSSTPAIAPTRVERDSLRASRMVIRIIREPKTTDMNRQPREFMPNICSPSAMSHFPSGG
jgi:hypothetical protein